MIDSNKDIAVETPVIQENSLANSVVGIEDGGTKSRVFRKVEGECERIERNFTIRKNRSMGKLGRSQ